MTSENNIEEKLEKLAQAISPDDTLIENVMSRIDAEPVAGSYISPARNIWRTIMKSPITKLAAVAVIIIVCLTGLILWKSTGSGIALADVLTKIEQATGYMYRLRSTITKQQNTSKWAYTVLITPDGIKSTLEMMDPKPKNKKFVAPEMYLLPKKNALIAVSHETKTYIRMKFEDTLLEDYKERYNDPAAIIKQILSCNHTNLGKSVLDGIMVEGFQTTDPAYKPGFFGLFGQADLGSEPEKVDVKIWVDVNTFLPVRSEEDVLEKDGTYIHEVSSDFRWNVPAGEAGFEPEIPDDYKSVGGVGDINVPALNEENTINGLKLFANLAGEYPDNLSRETFYEKAKKLTGSDATSWKDLTDDEKTKITNDYYILKRPGEFYETLVLDEKEPAYYGETVGPDDADKVLLRWKLGDGRYRVIFGDLHADTVTTEALKKLETALQQ